MKIGINKLFFHLFWFLLFKVVLTNNTKHIRFSLLQTTVHWFCILSFLKKSFIGSLKYKNFKSNKKYLHGIGSQLNWVYIKLCFLFAELWFRTILNIPTCMSFKSVGGNCLLHKCANILRGSELQS